MALPIPSLGRRFIRGFTWLLSKINPTVVECAALLALVAAAYFVARYRLTSTSGHSLPFKPGLLNQRRA